MRSSTLFLRGAIAGLALVSASAWADGAGTLNEGAVKLTYDGGPYVAPNVTPLVFGLADMGPLCEPGTPSCDVYMLTVEFSDEFRAAQPEAFVDITLEYTNSGAPSSAGDHYDLYLYDAADAELASSATEANPEFISVPLDVLPNGTYKVVAIPFIPTAQTFTTTMEVSGLVEAKSSGVMGVGALTPLVLLPFALFGLLRRRG